MARKKQKPKPRSNTDATTRKGRFLAAFDAWNQTLTCDDASAESRALERVTFHLADPAWLAEAPPSETFPKEHVWRTHATVVRDALRLAVEEGLDAEHADVLKQVPRRSPLAPWVLLTRAIDAAYRERGPEMALRFLDRIETGSAVYAIARVLRAVLEGSTLVEPTKIEERLRDEISGIDEVARQRDRALHDPSDRAFLRALDGWSAIYHRVRAIDTQHAERLLVLLGQASVARDITPRGLHDFLTRFLPAREFLRIMALSLEVDLPRTAISFWIDVLEESRTRKDFPLIERLVLRRCIPLLARAEREFHIFLDDEEDDDELELDPRVRLLEVDPSAESFQLVIDSLHDDRAREACAERWHEAHPNDVRPLILLTEAAETRDAVRKALTWQRKAEALGSKDPRVRRGAFRLLLRSAEKRTAEAKWKLAAQDVDRLTTLLPDGRDDMHAYVHGLSWVVGSAMNDTARIEQAEAEFQERAWNVWQKGTWLSHMIHTTKTHALHQRIPILPPVPLEIARAVARGTAWCRRLGRRFQPKVPLVTEAKLLERLDDFELLQISYYLFDCAEWDALFDTSRLGLRGPDRHHAHHLRFRAAFLIHATQGASWDEADRIASCIGVARTMAERSGDVALLADLDPQRGDRYGIGVFARAWLERRSRVEDATIREVLARERDADREEPRTSSRSKKKKKKKKKKQEKKVSKPRAREATGSLFDDLDETTP
ncbi:MAG: hypothetical protein H6834_17235 [Planctomycetes bacterium]|nr:hypothetical protein [Planctomycetota bacterium]